jgi:sugar/nucleoside kinase (ribokinase family)
MHKKIPTVVILGRINHDMIYIEGKRDGTYRVNEDFGGPAAYSSIAAAAQGERVGLVSFAADEFLAHPMYDEIAGHSQIDLAGVRFIYDKMPLLKVWYPNREEKLTIGMIWDKNPKIKFEMIPDIYLKSNLFLFMPMINEIPAEVMKKVAHHNTDAIKFIDIQGKVRYLKSPGRTKDAEWEGMPKELVAEWVGQRGARRVFYSQCKELDTILKYTDILKANEGELSIISGVAVDDTAPTMFVDSIESGVEKLIRRAERVGNDDIVITVTLGSRGAYINYLDSKGNRVSEFIEAVKARKDDINPTGAGDTYAVAFLLAYRKSLAPVLATKYALAASSLGVEKEGPRDRPPKEDVYFRMIEYYGI